MTSWIRTTQVSVLLCGVLAMPLAWSDAAPSPSQTRHLNIVYSVTDADAVNQFYGEVLGLRRIANIDFPGDMYMIRYMAGATEVKFIVTGDDLPSMDGGTQNARGIRLLAILQPESARAGIVERANAAGLTLSDFTEGTTAENQPYRYTMLNDFDGNQVELVFWESGIPEDRQKQAQIGLAVSDLNAMDTFLTDVLGYMPATASGNPNIHRFQMGATQLKFWQVDAALPAWNGGPFDTIGMNLVQAIVPNVDAVREAVIARGGTIHTEPFPLGQIATIMFVEGPDGILFEFAGPLAKRFRK